MSCRYGRELERHEKGSVLLAVGAVLINMLWIGVLLLLLVASVEGK